MMVRGGPVDWGQSRWRARLTCQLDVLPAVRAMIEKMVAARASKFVFFALSEPSPDGWTAEAEHIAVELLALES